MTELWDQTAVDLARAIREKEISSRELLQSYLARIDRINPAVNAVVTMDAQGAFDAADASDEAVANGADLGPLHGLPITVKDALQTAGMRSTGGAEELAEHVPDQDAPSVAAIKTAGAIVFGKTNVPKWSGDVQTHNKLFGATRNPWDVTLSPGGSSGGPAVSVACGFTSFEIGTDIGGSIRMPAHFTGICGHKPSYGIVPSTGYLDHVGGGTTEADINVVGPLARSVDDLELLLRVMSGPGPENAQGWRLDLPPARKGLRVGLWLDDPGCPVAAEVLTILQSAASLLELHGAHVDDTTRPVSFEESMKIFFPMLASAVSPGQPEEVFEMAKTLDAIPREPGEDPLIEMGRGTVIRHRDWIRLDERRASLRRKWSTWFGDHDVLLCPVVPVVAQPLSDENLMTRRISVDGVDRSANDLILWPGLIGIVYLPSTVVPVGRTEAGLPVGVQVVGPFLGDLTTLRVARMLEEATGGFRPPPV